MTWRDLLLYLAPLSPVVSRGLLCLAFRRQMGENLTEGELDRETHRTYILALAGFSFAGLLALIVLERTLEGGFRLGVYYLLLSFLGFLASLNLQSYKSSRFQDQLGTTLMEIGTLDLVLSILAVLAAGSFGRAFTRVLSALAVIVWASDHAVSSLPSGQLPSTKKRRRNCPRTVPRRLRGRRRGNSRSLPAPSTGRSTRWGVAVLSALLS